MANDIQPPFLVAVRPQDSTAGIVRNDFGVRVGIDFFGALYGVPTSQLPVTILSDSNPGYIQVSFVDDFYNRVHFTPNVINFGVVAIDTPRSISIWNAYLIPVTLDVIVIGPEIGVIYSGGPSLPGSLGPLADTTMTFTAFAQEGDRQFNTTILFTFANGETYAIRTLGDRAVIPELGPNWRDGMTETLEFLTEIVNVTRDGKEQRRAIRPEARMSLSYTMTVWGPHKRNQDGFFTQWRRRPQLVPVEPHRAVVAGEVGISQVEIPLKGVAPPWMVAGAQIIIRHGTIPGGITTEVVSTLGDVLTVRDPTFQIIPAGARILRMMTARMRDQIKTVRRTNEADDVRIVMDNVPGFDPEYTPLPAIETLNGYEVFTLRPDWSTDPEIEWDMPLEVLDFGYGRPHYQEIIDLATYSEKQLFSARREEDILEVRDFFTRQRGRQGEFYRPTFAADIVPGYQLDYQNFAIRVVGPKLARYYGEQKTVAGCIVYLLDGTHLVRQVDSVYEVTDGIGNDSIVQVATNWPYDILPEEIEKISWLHRCRLGVDTLEIEWLTDAVATTQLTFTTLENLP